VSLCAAVATLAPLVQAATEQWPPRPTAYVVKPGTRCVPTPVKGQGGTRTMLAPPSPGLRANAVSLRTVALAWSFETLPENCRPEALTLGIVTNRSTRATPTTRYVPISGLTGTKRITYPSFLPPPNVAMARAVMENGLGSPTVMVRVRR
jgi:hypothetical protein